MKNSQQQQIVDCTVCEAYTCTRGTQSFDQTWIAMGLSIFAVIDFQRLGYWSGRKYIL